MCSAFSVIYVEEIFYKTPFSEMNTTGCPGGTETSSAARKSFRLRHLERALSSLLSCLQAMQCVSGSQSCHPCLGELVIQLSLSCFCSCKLPLTHTLVCSPQKTHWFNKLYFHCILTLTCCQLVPYLGCWISPIGLTSLGLTLPESVRSWPFLSLAARF